MSGEDELSRVRRLERTLDEHGPVGGDDNVIPHQPPEDVPLGAVLTPEMRLMFGASFNPQPFGYVITRGDLFGNSCLFLTIEFAHGRFAIPLSDLEASGLANRLTQMARQGIVLATDMPTP